jgi:hypothetical protein
MKIQINSNFHVQIKQQEFDAFTLRPRRPESVLRGKGDGNPAKLR